MKWSLAFQGCLIWSSKDKIWICWSVQKPRFSAFEKGTKNDWNTFSFPYPSKIAIGSDLIIQQMSIRRGFKSFQLKKSWSGQKFSHFGSDMISVVNIEDFWVCYLPKALLSMVNEQLKRSLKPPKVLSSKLQNAESLQYFTLWSKFWCLNKNLGGHILFHHVLMTSSL